MPEPPRVSRLELVRDVVVFQGKLLLDGARDALLIPTSLIAAAIDLLTGRTAVGNSLYRRVLEWGRRSERFVNLFGPDGEREPRADERASIEDLDGLIAALESQLRDPTRRAALSGSARRTLESTLERLQFRQRGAASDRDRG